ncbi:MAG: histidinol-phosphate transaminase [Fibrobacterales bacterium]
MSMVRPALSGIKAYIPGKSVQEVQQEFHLSSIIKLASNENPLGVSRKAQEAIAAVSKGINRYPLGHSPELTHTIATKLGLNPQNILFSNGSDEMIQMITATYLNPGEEVLSSEHTFSEYKFGTLLFDGTYRSVPMDNWNHDLAGIRKAITKKTKIIFICNPNNPTGTWIPKKELTHFLSEIPKGVMVVVDQAYNEYATHPEYPDLIDEINEFENLILLRTFSKVYGLAGLRIGYALAQSITIETMLKVKQPFNVNIIAQAAAEAVLSDTDYIQNSMTTNIEGMEQLYAYFDSKKMSYLETQGNFIAVHIGFGAIDLVKTLESRGMIIRSLKSFDMPEWVRITIGLKEQNDVLIALLEECLV